MSTGEQLVFLLVIGGRFVLPLFIPKFPLPAIISCLVLDGIDRIRGPLPAGEPAAREERPHTDRTSQADTPLRVEGVGEATRQAWRSNPEVERLLAAAGGRDPAALQLAQNELQASAAGQVWRERVEAHQRDFAAQERTPNLQQTEQRTPAQMDVAR